MKLFIKIWTNVYTAVTSAPRMHDVRIPMVRTDVSARMDSHLERTAEFATVSDKGELPSFLP